MRYSITLLVLLIAACGASPSPAAKATPATPEAEAADSLAGYEVDEVMPPKALASKDGVLLEMVYLRKTGSEERFALLRFRGIEHPLAGIALLAKRTKKHGDKFWRTTYDGLTFTLVWVLGPGLGQTAGRTELDLPRVSSRIALDYDSALSRDIDVDELFALHRRQMQDGSIAGLEAIDRDYHASHVSQIIERDRAAIAEDCGENDIALEIDLESLFRMERHYRKSCSSVFAAAARVCRRDADSRRTFLTKTKKLTCVYGESHEIVISEAGEIRSQIGQASIAANHLYKEMVKVLKLTRSVLEDDSGRILVLDPDSTAPTKDAYLGDGITMKKLARLPGQHILWEPLSFKATIYANKDDVAVQCPAGTIRFRTISAKRRHKVLSEGSFEGPRWTREALALARDDRGTYYYVDRQRLEFGGKGYRVFLGKRGQVKVTPLVDIVDDSDGLIFATRSGKLRLVLRNKKGAYLESAQWIDGKKKRSLEVLPLTTNRTLIYSELGAYDGERFGTICE